MRIKAKNKIKQEGKTRKKEDIFSTSSISVNIKIKTPQSTTTAKKNQQQQQKTT